MTEFLTAEDLIVISVAIAGEGSVRDYGLLEAAVRRPQATVFGEDAYPGPHGKAAALLHSLVRNHALVDGNKRLGWVAVRLFYVMNDAELRPSSPDDAFDLVTALADGSLAEVDKIADTLRRWAVLGS